MRLALLLTVFAGCNNAAQAPDVGPEAGSPDAMEIVDTRPVHDTAVTGDSDIARDADPAQDGPGVAPDAGCASCQDGDGCCGPGCTYRDDSDCPVCDPTIGVPVPLPTCSAKDPCTDLLKSYTLAGIKVLTAPTATAVCKTTSIGISLGRTAYDDGSPMAWSDADGVTRTWCEHKPAGTSPTSKRPLVIYIHGSGGVANTVYDVTNLRAKAVGYDLSGDPGRQGFILVASQGRYLHWPTSSPQDGSKHDSFHRDLTTGSKNRDIAFIDHVVDTVVSSGIVDTKRIYIMGWSNGARFAAFYGIARHKTPTPGGHNVAAVANYSGGDPFENITQTQTPSCKLASYPTTAIPLFMVSRSCDIVACDAAQDLAFQSAGVDPVPGNIAGGWIATMKTKMGDPNVSWLLINAFGTKVNQCTPSALCLSTIALLNHLRWPDGVNDKSGNDHEPAMLDFLAQHALP